jgi:hypothetical protein
MRARSQAAFFRLATFFVAFLAFFFFAAFCLNSVRSV